MISWLGSTTGRRWRVLALRLTNKQYASLIGNTSHIHGKPSKYRNYRVVVDGVRYDSQKEYERHMHLKLLEKKGEISELKFHQKEMNILLQDDPPIRYEPDFCYYEDGTYIIEDLKGYQTKEFKLKKKMLIHMIRQGKIDGVLRLTKQKAKSSFEIIEEYRQPQCGRPEV